MLSTFLRPHQNPKTSKSAHKTLKDPITQPYKFKGGSEVGSYFYLSGFLHLQMFKVGRQSHSWGHFKVLALHFKDVISLMSRKLLLYQQNKSSKRCIDRVPYFSLLTKNTFQSLNANIATFHYS